MLMLRTNEDPSSTTLIIPSEADSFSDSYLVVRDSENEVTTISPYYESESINSVTDLVNTLNDVSISEEKSFNFDDRQLKALRKYDLAELAPAIYTLADHCDYLKIRESIIPISVIETLLQRYTPEYIVHILCSADNSCLEELVSSPDNIFEVFENII